MKTKKEFDCVEMKNAIQRRLQRRRSGMSSAEEIADIRKSVAESHSSVAVWWRGLEHKQAEGSREAAATH